MGKNLTATLCEKCNEELCYYGTTICNKCELVHPTLKCECNNGKFFTSITGEIVCSCKLNNTAKQLGEEE